MRQLMDFLLCLAVIFQVLLSLLRCVNSAAAAEANHRLRAPKSITENSVLVNLLKLKY